MKKTVKLMGIITLLCATISANAAILKVDYQLNNMSFSGSFSGVDTNADGFLKHTELTGFSFLAFADLGLSKLQAFGDYDIANNLWLNNAISWLGSDANAWFTWDNRNLSVSSFFVSGTTTTLTVFPETPQVPVPAAMWLFGSALAGLLGLKPRKIVRF